MAFPEFNSSFVANALSIPSGQAVALSGVATDSRKIMPGCLFVALIGENFDGNAFVDTAIEKGASAVLCHVGAAEKQIPGAVYFEVPDTLEAYRKLAGAWREQFKFPVYAVAGSVGKTSTKEILTAALRGKYKTVLKTQGSLNGFIGTAMTLLEFNASVDAAVVEIGIDEPGAMIQHMKLVKPTASVLTPIGPEHLEKLRDLKTVASEEGIALTFVADSGGSVAINLDDPWIRPYLDQIQSRKKIGFRLNPDARPGNGFVGKISSDGQSLTVTGGNWKQAETFALPLLGRHNAMNLLAAISIAHSSDITPDQIREGLLTFEGAEGRSQVRTLSNGTKILCDYYNASPPSMEAAFALLTQLARGTQIAHRRIACLADMMELGAGEEGFHRDLAVSIKKLAIEEVYLFGTRMKWLEDQLKQDHFNGILKHFDSREALIQEVSGRLIPESVLLIKGSHSLKMEEVWKALKSK